MNIILFVLFPLIVAQSQERAALEREDKLGPIKKQGYVLHAIIEGRVGCSVGGEFKPLNGIQVYLYELFGQQLTHHVTNKDGKFRLSTTVWERKTAVTPHVNVALSCEYFRSDSQFAACDTLLSNGDRVTMKSICEANPGKSLVIKKRLRTQTKHLDTLRCSLDIDLDGENTMVEYHKDPQTTDLQYAAYFQPATFENNLPQCTVHS